MMDVTFSIPDDLAQRITAAWHRMPDTPRGTVAYWREAQKLRRTMADLWSEVGTELAPVAGSCPLLALLVADAHMYEMGKVEQAKANELAVIQGPRPGPFGPLPAGVTQ